MKNRILTLIILGFGFMFSFSSCEEPDSEKEWGLAKIYMPQAKYDPYNATADQPGATCSIDAANNKLNVFLGVYRSGLQELNEYSVDVVASAGSVAGTVELPSTSYTLPSRVTCPAGERDVTFYLTVDLDFLQQNIGTDYSLTITVSNPTNYELNEELTATNVLIKPSELLN